MAYHIKIKARADREAIIRSQLAATHKKEEFYEFRNKPMQLEVIRLEISIPVYRMVNFRTFTAQREFICQEKKNNDFFSAGQELQSVQQRQHEILVELSRRGKTGSVTPIFDVLRDDGQRESILVSSAGVVVNGNRRVAAMRELLTENPGLHAGFSHVDCMVLPGDATAEEIVDIEASLQAKLETKLDYDWIGDAQLVNHLVNYGRTPSEIGKRLNRTEADIKNTVQALEEADIYLRDWVGAVGNYNRISEDAEQLFKDIPKLIAGKNSGLQDASRAIAWTLLENRRDIPGRIYNYNAAIGKLAPDVLRRMSDELDISIVKTGTDDNADDFDVDIESDQEGNNYSQLIEALRDEKTKVASVSALIDACESAIEMQKGQKSAEAALKAISQAHARLASVDLSRAGTATHSAMKKQLSAIAKIVDGLLAKLTKLNK